MSTREPPGETCRSNYIQGFFEEMNDRPYRRLDLPTFTGEDPIGWVARAEKYFAMNGITEEDKVTAALICFEGASLGWLQFKEMSHPFLGWNELKEEMMKQFTEGQLRTPRILLTLRQERTIAEFRERFEWLSSAAQCGGEKWVKDLFLALLKDEIQADVHLLGPTNLEKMMDLAQEVEVRNSTLKGDIPKPNFFFSVLGQTKTESLKLGPPIHSFSRSSVSEAPQKNQSLTTTNCLKTSVSQNNSTPPKTTQAVGTTQPKRGQGYKKLTPIEFQSKLEKGLCFRCDEKFTPGHKCQSKQLRVMLVQVGEEGEEDLGCCEEGNPEEGEMFGAELSQHSLVGLDSPKTLKVKGEIEGGEVLVLIDCGATHNFLARGLVERLGLTIYTRRFTVTLGDGKEIQGCGVCRSLPILLQGERFEITFLVLDLGNVEVILEVEWLSTIGEAEEGEKK